MHFHCHVWLPEEKNTHSQNDGFLHSCIFSLESTNACCAWLQRRGHFWSAATKMCGCESKVKTCTNQFWGTFPGKSNAFFFRYNCDPPSVFPYSRLQDIAGDYIWFIFRFSSMDIQLYPIYRNVGKSCPLMGLFLVSLNRTSTLLTNNHMNKTDQCSPINHQWNEIGFIPLISIH